MSECNVDEILKQIRVLDNLKQLKENMGANFFMETFPELNGMGGRLDTVIEEQENLLKSKMDECGQVDLSELPGLPEPEPLPEIDIPVADTIGETIEPLSEA